MKRRTYSLMLTAALLLAWLVAVPATAYAQSTITVTTTDDEFGGNTDDSCSLREAVQAVNTGSDFGGCTVDGTAPFMIDVPAGTYTLTLDGSGEDMNATGDLDVMTSVAITGAGADGTIIQAGPEANLGIDRVFHVVSAADVTLSGVTVQNGQTEADGSGGAIANTSGGLVRLVDSVVANSAALGDEAGEGGGGIWNAANGSLLLNNTRVINNSAITELGNGGGILNGPDATLTVNDGEISGNAAARAGGGVENNGGVITFNNATFTNNTAGINGGALHISADGLVEMLGGSATGNAALAEGGALWNSAVGTLNVENATLDGNTASGADADQGGGAIHNDGGVLSVTDSTLINNVADGAAGSGGGILAVPGSLVYVMGGEISANSSMRAGGAIEVNGTEEMPVKALLSGVTFNNNSTGAAPGNGGVLHITGVADVTVVNASASSNNAAAEGGALWVSGAGTLTVIGGTYDGNVASGDDADMGGGALYNDGGQLTVIGATLTNNTANGASGSGGAILVQPGSLTEVAGTTISGNSSNRAGGGIEVNATDDAVAMLKLKNVDFANNSTGAAPGNGGALHITGPGDVTALNGTISGNAAAAEGGGFWNSAVGTLTVNGARFEANTASGADADMGGGALYNDGGMLTVVNAQIVNNVADGASGSGGGLLAQPGSMVTVTGGDINGNTSNRAGGGIEVNATMTDTVTVDLTGVRLSNNATGAAPGNGGALHITGPGTVNVISGLVSGNMAAAEGGGLWNSAVGTLNVTGVTLTGNTASGADADQGGGALFNDGGTLNVTNSVIEQNVADGASGSGGGILNNGGTLNVSGGTFVGNTSNRAGGAIEDNAGASVTLDDVDFFNNSTGAAPGNGGALHITGAGNVSATGGMVNGNTAAAEGGGFWNSAVGTLNVDGTRFANNVASGDDADQGGGALFNDGGTLTVTNSVLHGNVADGASGSGGGILANAGSTLNVSDTMINDNTSNRAGGGIEVNATMTNTVTADLSNVTLDGNSTGAAPGNGGALHITGPATVSVSNSTVSNNMAAAQGGGLWNSAVGVLNVSRSAISDNSVTGTDAMQGGGGLYNDGGQLTASNSTVWRNQAAVGSGVLNAAGSTTLINTTVFANVGSGIFNVADSLTISNSIVAQGPQDGDACAGDITTNGPNLDDDGTCGASITADPMLNPFGNYGGDTGSHLPMPGSPAIDAGDNNICAAPPVNGIDQRGVARPQGAQCDLGSIERRDNEDDGDGGDGDGDGDGGNADNAQIVYVSSNTGGTVDGINFGDMDILAHNMADDSWSLFFDASDVGIRSNDLDGFTVLSNGDILMSFTKGMRFDGIDQYVFASDVVRFVPDSLGAQTSGGFQPYLNGSAVGLNSAGNGREDIDAVALAADGRTVLSTKGTFFIPGIRGRDEDLIALAGEQTSGFMRRYFDGSDVELFNFSEDVIGTYIDASGDIFLTTKGDFETGGISGNASDIFVCTPLSLGAQTDCTFRLFWRGADNRFGGEVVDGIALGSGFPAQYDPAMDVSAADVIDDNEVDVDIDSVEEWDIELTPEEHAADDTADGSEQTGAIFLPLVNGNE